jgi:Flp pilus assembly protein CpaB
MRSLLARLRQVRRRILIHRRPLAALAAAGAVLVILQAAMAPPAPTVPVWTASRDLPGGTVLSAADLTRTSYAPGSVPARALDSPGGAIGRTLAAPLSKGEPLTTVRLVGPRLLTGYPGLVAVPVRITDPAVVGLMRVGDRITLTATDPQGQAATRTIAEDVPVIALPRAGTTALDTGLPGRLVVVGVRPEVARDLTAAGVSGYISVIWTS